MSTSAATQLGAIAATLANVRQLAERISTCTGPNAAYTLLQVPVPLAHSMPGTTFARCFSSAANFPRLPGVPTHVPAPEQNALLAKCASVICGLSPQYSSTSALREACAVGLTAYASP